MFISISRVDETTIVLRPHARQLCRPESLWLREQIHASLEDARYLVLDLAMVQQIDSHGLGVLMEGLRVARGAGGDLSLTDLTASLQAQLGERQLLATFFIQQASRMAA